MVKFRHKLIDPFVIPVVIIAIIWFSLMGLGKLYLSFYTPGEELDRIDRPELWVGVGIVVGIIALMAFLASRPAGAVGPLDDDVVLGSRPFFGPQLPNVDENARSGEPGKISDITSGYTVYASNGQLGEVVDMLPGGTDYGKTFAGFIYTNGDRGASDELWIPVEAVSAVYPETRSVFLAVKGDETEAFGWNTPPENFNRGPAKYMTSEEKVKNPTRYPRKY